MHLTAWSWEFVEWHVCSSAGDEILSFDVKRGAESTSTSDEKACSLRKSKQRIRNLRNRKSKKKQKASNTESVKAYLQFLDLVNLFFGGSTLGTLKHWLSTVMDKAGLLLHYSAFAFTRLQTAWFQDVCTSRFGWRSQSITHMLLWSVMRVMCIKQTLFVLAKVYDAVVEAYQPKPFWSLYKLCVGSFGLKSKERAVLKDRHQSSQCWHQDSDASQAGQDSEDF